MKTFIFTLERVIEETWYVDAESRDEALALLKSQDGGECVQEEDLSVSDFEFQGTEDE